MSLPRGFVFGGEKREECDWAKREKSERGEREIGRRRGEEGGLFITAAAVNNKYIF